MSTAERTDIDDGLISHEEALRLFDETARLLLGISGDEFRRRWHAGEYYDVDTDEVISLYMMLPMVEYVAPAHAS
jgi:hypothetical protein